MRVTNNMMIINMMRNMNTNLTNMSKYQDQLSTGKEISSPMDDPVGIAKVLKYKTDLSELDQFGKNARDAKAWLDNTETALIDVNSVYQRMRELAVQAANGTNTAEETQKIKSEIEQLKGHTVKLANSTFAGRYVFSSFHTDEKLMNEDGTYNIDITNFDIVDRYKTIYQVGVGENIEVSSNGLDVFGYEALSNFSTSFMPDAQVEGTAAEPAKMPVTIDLETNYSGSTIQVTINSKVYTVDNTQFAGSSAFPLTKEGVTDAILSAPGAGGGKLSDVANVYFDDAGKLVVSTRGLGDSMEISQTSAGSFFGGTTANGADRDEAVVQGPAVLDSDVTAATAGDEYFLVSLNGETKKVSITFPLADVNAVVSDLQASMNSEFGTGKIVVSNTGGKLTFSTSTADDSSEKQVLAVRPIQTTQSTVMKDMDDFIAALETNDKTAINDFIGKVDDHLTTVLQERADIGARVNRMDLVLNRIAENNVNFTRLLSDAEDADMSEVIMYLKNAENVYRASLQTGARVIQPSLLDFLR